MRSLHTRLRLGAIVISAVLAATVAVPAIGRNGVGPTGTVDVQLLAINDFHGNLEPPSGSSGRIGVLTGIPPVCVAPTCYLAGGVEYLATHVKNLEAANPNTVVLSAGDVIGASPLVSALFHDEPTIEAMNLLGLDVNAVGNHEFDEGTTELLRMQEGGCHPTDGCLDGDGFAGADFRFLAANVTWKSNHKPIFPAYKLFSFGGAKLAVIGVVTKTTPSIVLASGIQAVDFADEADTVNALIPELKKKGIGTVVVLIHEGGIPTGGYNECPGISGPIVDIVNRTDPEVDLFISGHTHQAYNCVIDGRPVSSGSSYGRLVTDIDMTIDRGTDEPTAISVDNKIVTRDVAKDPAETALIARYAALAAPFANRVVGHITADITKTQDVAGESRLGDFIADSQQFVSASPSTGGAVAAFMNPGGIRTDLLYAASDPETEDGVVRYTEIFAVQPFGNSLVTMTVTGAQIEQMLEEQFLGTDRILQVSSGFTYSWSLSAAEGSKVAPASVFINGAPLDLAASYRVTVNSFLADGGDSFPSLKLGTDRLGGDVDLDAVEKYFASQAGPVAPPALDRIVRLP